MNDTILTVYHYRTDGKLWSSTNYRYIPGYVQPTVTLHRLR